MANELVVYDVFQGAQVRKVDMGDGKVWRVLIDCCKAVGMGNVTWVMKRIPNHHFRLTKALGSDGRMRQHWLIDEVGLIDMIAYGRLPKEQLDAFREWIGQKVTAPDNAMASADVTALLIQLTKDVAELKAARVPLKTVIDYGAEVRMLLNDWVKKNRQNPKIHHQSAHGRLNELFYYKHHSNINIRHKRSGKSALQIAIDIGKGEEIYLLALELVDHDFYGYFNESADSDIDF